jgi:Ca-activated chloride channel family protein
MSRARTTTRIPTIALPLLLAACQQAGFGEAPKAPPRNDEAYGAVVENDFAAVSAWPISTLGLDVDTASYQNVRDLLRRGQLPPADAVRVEEFVNAFPSRVASTDGDEVLAVAHELQPCPWQPEHWLLRVAVRAKDASAEQVAAPARLVFLIDVSGSMSEPDKLSLVQRGLAVLIDALQPQDRVAIVTYGDRAEVAVADATAADKERLHSVVSGLRAGGSTNGAEGLRTACKIAAAMPGAGPRRVVLVTDGDFNVGDSSPEALGKLLASAKGPDTFLTAVGCGRGNLKATNLAAVAKAGDGSFHYLDGMAEAKRLFGARFAGPLSCVARDVKVQVEFNPANVASWRLLGYEDRVLAPRDLADASKDGGEVGAGQTVVALYELVGKGAVANGGVALRYGSGAQQGGVHLDEVAQIAVAYRPVAGDGAPRQRRVGVPAGPKAPTPSHDFLVSSTAAAFALQLRNSRFRGELDWAKLVRMTDRLDHADVQQHELAELVATAERLSRSSD